MYEKHQTLIQYKKELRYTACNSYRLGRQQHQSITEVTLLCVFLWVLAYFQSSLTERPVPFQNTQLKYNVKI